MKKLILLLTFLPTLLFGQPTNLFNATNAIYLFGADKNGVPIVPTNTALVLATNKGSLIVGNGTNVIEFQKGSDGYYLMIDDTAETGLKWNSITMPEYSGEAKKLTINSQTLTGDKTLQCQVDEVCQVLNPNGENYNITLTGPNRGDFFIIKNSGNSGLLTVKYSGNTISTVITNETKQFIYDNANWITITIDNLPTETLTNIYNDSKGWIGISNTTPQATLDVVGNIRSSTGISPGLTNTTLSGNVTLTSGFSEQYQFLSDGGALRTIGLSSAAKNGDSFFIRNTSDNSSTYYFGIYDVGQAVIIDYLFAGKGKWYVFYNSSWHAVDDYAINNVNMSSGYNAKAFNNGMAYGYLSDGSSYGAAFGYQANGTNYGAAVGYGAKGYNHGAAFGYQANGTNYGAAVGRYANGSSSGTAVGYSANGSISGVAVGLSANGSSLGTAVGYTANGSISGVAVGFSANGNNYGVAVGRNAGYRQNNGKENIFIGYRAGYNNDVDAVTNGLNNILIGANSGTINDCSNYLNIGNAIFGTNVQTKTGTNIDLTTKIGIATNDPHYTLEVHGDIGLGQNGNLYKGGEKLGWYSTGTFSQYGTTSITFPVTNAVYKIEGWGQAQSNETNITASSAGIYYGASDTQDKIVNIRMASAAGGGSDQAKLPFYFADIVEVNLESERVNYWKIKASGGVGVTVSGYYILTRIR